MKGRLSSTTDYSYSYESKVSVVLYPCFLCKANTSGQQECSFQKAIETYVFESMTLVLNSAERRYSNELNYYSHILPCSPIHKNDYFKYFKNLIFLKTKVVFVRLQPVMVPVLKGITRYWDYDCIIKGRMMKKR